MSIYNYSRRDTVAINAGGVEIGGGNPIRVQSMTNTSTLDTEGSAAQIIRIAEAGGEIVRLTTQGVREAENMQRIRSLIRERGCGVPLVADVHFNPRAAFVAATTCDKVRINPGNFADAARTFKNINLSEAEYEAELEKMKEKLRPFYKLCKDNGVAVRLGVNHGSLSDRIMTRYGDTSVGMVESVMEYLRVAVEEDFRNIVISIKASTVPLMVETVELLCRRMDAEEMAFPLHLGVTEAGDGEDGRIKSAVGIGALLANGIGDTIRVSLSEAPENEIPVAALLRDYIASRSGHAPIKEPEVAAPGISREITSALPGMAKFPVGELDFDPRNSKWHHVDASQKVEIPDDAEPIVIGSRHVNPVGEIASWIDRFVAAGGRNPVILHLSYEDGDADAVRIKAGADAGALLLHGYGNALWIDAPALGKEKAVAIALGILQGARLRMEKTEYIACPGCGRTLFDLPSTLSAVRKATSHLKGLKIGVMGCIVNGPGEMADADYGYVGAAPGKITLYKGREAIEKNLPADKAVEAMIALIKRCGDWQEPDQRDIS